METKRKLGRYTYTSKIDFKTKINKKPSGHSIMMKGSIQQEDIAFVNIYTPNRRAPKYIRQT